MESDKKYVCVDWGDGWLVYEDGKYIGKDDQVDPWEFLERAGLLEFFKYPDDDTDWLPYTVEELPDLEAGRL